ncbi:four helix bundle protein [Patescibacteria group bacterium]|nr:four helix bundle protein [Patescibacteria group bacterium]
MAAFRFKDFEVYKDAKAFRKDVMKLIKRLLDKRAYDLADQIKRASLSIVLNIAEGSTKKSDADFARFL